MNSEPRIPFPEDLREWVEESILVEVLPKSASGLSSNLAAAGEQPPSCESLLRVLGFSYATGRYYSEDIEESCYRVAALKTMCDRQGIPKAAELRAFRRSHHLQLHELLCRVIEVASAKVSRSLDSDRLGQAVEAEAQRRLEAAMLADTSTLDV